MKIITLLCFLSIFIITGCNKNSGTSTITPVVPSQPDTLTTGWTRIVVDSTDNFNDIYFSNSSIGFLTGRNGAYKSVNGGVSWTKIAYPQIHIVNLSVTPDGKLFGANFSDSIYRSTDAGFTFSNFRIPGGVQVSDVYFIDNNNGFAALASGLARTTDGGITWSVVSTSGLGTTASNGYSSVFFINSTTGWVSRNFDIYKTNGNINNWVKSIIPGIVPNSNAIIFISAVSSSVVFAGYDNGTIYKSVDGGTTFSLISTLPSSSGLLDIHFLDVNNGYCGYGNRIYKSTDGGNSWQPVVSLGVGIIVEIHFVDINNGWGCTSSGSIVRFHQ